MDLPSNRSIPRGPVIPVLQYNDVAEAAVWLCRVFGFRERLRIGSHRIQLHTADGEGAVVVAEGAGMDSSTAAAASNHSIMVRVNNVDQHFQIAQTAGATILTPLTTYPYGERQYSAADCGGHRWTFSQSVEDVHPEAWGGDWLEEP